MNTYTYILIILLLNSCITPSKYNELKKRSNIHDYNIEKLHDEIDKLDNLNRSQSNIIIKLIQDTIKLSKKYEILDHRYNDNIEGGSSNIVHMSRQTDNARKEIIALRRNIDQYQKDIKRKEFEFNEFRDLVYSFLMSFSNEGIKMISNGDAGTIRLIVDDALLFEPGGYLLTVESGNLVSYIASFLGRNKDIITTIVSNTDKSDSIVNKVDTISNKDINESLELSAKRSIEISREILKNEYVSPDKIITSGRNSSNPVTNNTDELSKSKNRRTEFILSRNNYYE